MKSVLGNYFKIIVLCENGKNLVVGGITKVLSIVRGPASHKENPVKKSKLDVSIILLMICDQGCMFL